jgi:hypothetical protein
MISEVSEEEQEAFVIRDVLAKGAHLEVQVRHELRSRFPSPSVSLSRRWTCGGA